MSLDFKEREADLREEYPNETDDELYQIMWEENDEALNIERENLDIVLPRGIIVIADLGLWNGRRSGYKEIASGNIKDCLYSDTDYTEWFVDQYGDLRADAIHHDGTNHYLYRVYKDTLSVEAKAYLKEKIYTGRATRWDIEKATDSIGKRICEVYGWEIPTPARNKEMEER